MFLKILVVVLFIANLVALGSAFVTLMQDQGKTGRRTARLLSIRVSLAVLLLAVVAYGLYTGQLGTQVPWLDRD